MLGTIATVLLIASVFVAAYQKPAKPASKTISRRLSFWHWMIVVETIFILFYLVCWSMQ